MKLATRLAATISVHLVCQMLKPMEGLLGGMDGFVGTTLLGDGRVLIVLDLQEILR